MNHVGRQTNILAAKFLLCSIGLSGLVACSAQTLPVVPADWKNECVGRMQLSLPGDAETSAYPLERMEEGYKKGSNRSYFVFPDGQDADFTDLKYGNLGLVYISHALKPDQSNALLDAAKASSKRAQAYALDKKKIRGKPLIFEDLGVAPLVGHADRVNRTVDATVLLDQYVVRTSATGGDDYPDWNARDREKFDVQIKGLAFRPFAQLPKAPGVCLPYSFIQDDGQQGRSIAVTYRLKDHPDVTVWLEDTSAQEVQSNQNPSKFTPEYKTEFFWKQRYQDPISGRNIANGTGDIKINNRKGIATFLELTRKDKTIDYGYSVVANGDPDAKEDTPDLMMYVIRDAKNAIAKGKEPIGKDEFLKLAQTIAASVKQRPVK